MLIAFRSSTFSYRYLQLCVSRWQVMCPPLEKTPRRPSIRKEGMERRKMNSTQTKNWRYGEGGEHEFLLILLGTARRSVHLPGSDIRRTHLHPPPHVHSSHIVPPHRLLPFPHNRSQTSDKRAGDTREREPGSGRTCQQDIHQLRPSLQVTLQ